MGKIIDFQNQKGNIELAKSLLSIAERAESMPKDELTIKAENATSKIVENSPSSFWDKMSYFYSTLTTYLSQYGTSSSDSENRSFVLRMISNMNLEVYLTWQFENPNTDDIVFDKNKFLKISDTKNISVSECLTMETENLDLMKDAISIKNTEQLAYACINLFCLNPSLNSFD
ncbi:MAG: hypothetical protein K6E13_02095 [Lachnospiraceae bacterium]|nr:hypothetical protein [Lachnospiraceae bacterium]